MGELYRLCYVSRSRIPSERRVAERMAILTHSVPANRAAGITGVLIASGEYFCQVLEGPGPMVEQIFESIQLDSRHEAITVLEFVRIDARVFADWDMAWFDRDHDDGIGGQLRDRINRLRVVETGRPILAVFDQLIHRRESEGEWLRLPGNRPAA